MNIRFYLNANCQSALTARHNVNLLGHHQVHRPNGQLPFVDCSSETDAKEFNERYPYFIADISIKGHLPTSTQRARGEYLLGNAFCTLDVVDQGRSYEFQVSSRRCSASNADPSLEDALRVVDGLRRGTIAPCASWDAPQITKEPRTRKHLRERTRPRFRLGARQSTVY